MICNKILGKSHQIWRKTDKNSRRGEQIYGRGHIVPPLCFIGLMAAILKFKMAA